MTTELTSKQPSEAYAITFDFADVLGSTETIASVTSVVALDQADNSDVSATVLNVALQTNNTTTVSPWVRAGTAGHSYLITCKILGTLGSIYELDGLLPVDAIPPTLPSSGQGLVTGPVIEPITLAELKLQVKIDSDTTDDALLNRAIATAREHIEGYTRRAIMTQTWDVCFDRWPDKNYIKLPYGNLQSITSIKWKDTDGTETTLTKGTDYLEEKNGDQKGRAVLPYGESWPCDALYPSNPITVRFICGWTTAALVPYGIKSAILLLAADLYANREGQVLAPTSSVYQLNDTLSKLLWMNRLW